MGIDLGTTYSVVAYLDATGRPVTVVNGLGDLLTPSAVFFEDDGVIVGKEAVKSRCSSSRSCTSTVSSGTWGPLRPATSPRPRCPARKCSTPSCCERLKQDAERRLGPIRQAVITVPAFFDETRRKATQDAGRLATWRCSTSSMSPPRRPWPTDITEPPRRGRKRGQAPFAGTALRVLRTKGACPLFRRAG